MNRRGRSTPRGKRNSDPDRVPWASAINVSLKDDRSRCGSSPRDRPYSGGRISRRRTARCDSSFTQDLFAVPRSVWSAFVKRMMLRIRSHASAIMAGSSSMSTVETQSGTSAATAGSTPSSFSSVHFSNENSSEYSEFETLYWHLQKHAGHIVQGSAWRSVSSDHRA